MFAFRHVALASIAGLALSFGVMGCQPEQPDVIPSSAQMWSSGNGMMHYTAPADGTVYVYDHAAQRLIWSGKVMKGQAVDVDPTKMQIMAGGSIVVNKLSAPSDQKDIYFDASPVPFQAQQTWNNNNAPNNAVPNSNSVTVTPNVTVQPTDGSSTTNGVTVQPGVQVTPTRP